MPAYAQYQVEMCRIFFFFSSRKVGNKATEWGWLRKLCNVLIPCISSTWLSVEVLSATLSGFSVIHHRAGLGQDDASYTGTFKEA